MIASLARFAQRLRGTGVPWPSITLLLLVLLAAVGGEALAPHDPNGLDLAAAFRPPAWADKGSISHLLGTDNLGRDIFSRIIAGARVSLVSAAYAITIAGAIGALIGMISGFFGGWVDALLMVIQNIAILIRKRNSFLPNLSSNDKISKYGFFCTKA